MMPIDFKPVTLISPQTDAVTDPVFYPVQQRFLPVTIIASNLSGAADAIEKVTVLFSIDGGVTSEVLTENGAPVELTPTNKFIQLKTPMLIGVKKDGTALDSGVFIFSNHCAK